MFLPKQSNIVSIIEIVSIFVTSHTILRPSVTTVLFKINIILDRMSHYRTPLKKIAVGF